MPFIADTRRIMVAHLPRPDYTRPLRMQAAGRSPQETDRLRLKIMLWARALTDRFVWRRGIRSAFGMAAGQAVLLRTRPGNAPWLMAMIPLSTFIVAITSAASTCVSSHITRAELGRN